MAGQAGALSAGRRSAARDGAAAGIGVAAILLPLAASAEPPARPTLCGALEAAARRNDLPFAFFARLIWQESRFDPLAQSPAGAQGVAQFMPGTAAARGLLDPFEPTEALDQSAAYLKELRARFGNIGLAAAAYNAGPGRLGRWLAGTAGLPRETIDYVAIVTGHEADEWRGPTPPGLPDEPDFSCVAFAGTAGRRAAPSAAADPAAPPPKAWAVILVGSFNKPAVLAEWQLIRAKFADTLGPLPFALRRRRFAEAPARKFVVQIEDDSRAASERLCRRLEAGGGNCIVLRNLLR